jgi:glycerophosphoryl diester phosphodiesterase
VRFEIQAHRGNDALTLRRLLCAGPASVEVDVGLLGARLVVAHETDFSDASGLTVDDVFEQAGLVSVVLEAKCYPPDTPGPRAFAQALRPYLDRIALVSFDERALTEARRLCPSLQTTFLYEEPLRRATAAATLGPRADLVDAELVHAAHAVGLRVVPWTVNDAREMAALVDLGVDGLVTDEPALARRVVVERLGLVAA